MPYIIQTRKGKEKHIKTILDKFGVDSTISPMKEYIVCLSDLPAMARRMSHVLNVMEVSHDEARVMLNENLSGKKEIRISGGELVKVKAGVYEGFVGLVVAVEDKQAKLDINVFGKVLTIEAGIDEVERVKPSETWA
jgi:transcription antitermination factor NusG